MILNNDELALFRTWLTKVRLPTNRFFLSGSLQKLAVVQNEVTPCQVHNDL